VTFFTRIQKFLWNRIIGVKPFPQEASVGEFRKNLTPSKCRVVEIHQISFRVMNESDSQVWLLRVNLMSISGWLKPAKPWSRESAKIWNHEPTEPWSRESAKIWNHEPAKPWSRESVKSWNHELAKTWSHESAKLGNLVKFKFGGHDVRRSPYTRNSGTSKKPSQRYCLKSLGLTCELVAGL
jgi:hypothetical protein